MCIRVHESRKKKYIKEKKETAAEPSQTAAISGVFGN